MGSASVFSSRKHPRDALTIEADGRPRARPRQYGSTGECAGVFRGRNVGGMRHDRLMTEPAPETDDRHPADVVAGMVDHVLNLAATWPRWDGRHIEVPAGDGPARAYTPHKAIRRVADHMVDHLAEMEARLAGLPTEPDRWHASAITTPGDLAAFTTDDLDEARSRLRRLAIIWDVRLRSLSDQQLDERAGDAWTLRQLAFHLAESAFYADSVGKLVQ